MPVYGTGTHDEVKVVHSQKKNCENMSSVYGSNVLISSS